MPSARASVTAEGALQLGTNELFGEDPYVMIRLEPASKLDRLVALHWDIDIVSSGLFCEF